LNIDEPLMRIKADNTIRYYHTDALGSVIALSDDAGAIKTTYTYQPFGATIVTGEASDNPFQYTGRENDGTGFYYYRARYYSPELQRFISEDPIRFAGGINWFAYVGNKPLKFIDPTGLSGCGPGTIGDLLVPDDWPSYGFGKCCNAHDDCYGCKDKEAPSKDECDAAFYKCMMKECSKLYGYDKQSCVGNARLYYNMVHNYGHRSFKRARQ
jgi:RHS repeat-associated protein